MNWEQKHYSKNYNDETFITRCVNCGGVTETPHSKATRTKKVIVMLVGVCSDCKKVKTDSEKLSDGERKLFKENK